MSIYFTVLLLVISIQNGISKNTNAQKHIEVSMRMIGHQVLLNAGDSTSLVLPIEREDNQYRIRFSSDFELDPGQLITTVSEVFQETDIAKGYIVEVVKCGTNEVVHSYEIGDTTNPDILACRTRNQTKECYSLLITLLNPSVELNAIKDQAEVNEGSLVYSLLGLGALLLVGGGLLYLKSKRSAQKLNPDLVQIGQFQFDKKNDELILNQQRIELSSKESNLLTLLFEALNSTVEREVILNLVWGDNGDYIGRTLDVFISKLRKKLEGDSNLKIVNVRGVGYKLVLNN